MPVSKLDLGQLVASPYTFDRRIPQSEDALRALALYREALNAKHTGSISYAVLNFFKIIEIKHHNNPKAWFQKNFPDVPDGAYKEDFDRFTPYAAIPQLATTFTSNAALPWLMHRIRQSPTQMNFMRRDGCTRQRQSCTSWLASLSRQNSTFPT